MRQVEFEMRVYANVDDCEDIDSISQMLMYHMTTNPRVTDAGVLYAFDPKEENDN